MKSNIHIRYFLKLLIILFVCFCSNMLTVEAQNVNIPDANFKSYLKYQLYIDTNGDNEIQVSEANAYKGGIYCDNKNISNLEGIEVFVNISDLWCNDNQLTNLNLVNNIALKTIRCSNNQLTNLELPSNNLLIELFCNSNQLTILDVSKNRSLKTLLCSRNQLTSLNLTENIDLITLECSYNLINSLNVTANTKLDVLSCEYNQLNSLDVTKNVLLKYFICTENALSILDVSENKILKNLYCQSNQIASLDLPIGNQLEILNCIGNLLTTIDVTKNSGLLQFYCGVNRLINLDVSKNLLLTNLWCDNNQLTNIDITNNIKLLSLSCQDNQLTSLDITKNIALTTFLCRENPNLRCILVNDVHYSNHQINWFKDITANYVLECSNPEIKIKNGYNTLPNIDFNQGGINYDVAPDFGVIELGTTVIKTFTIENNSPLDLNITNFSINGAGFAFLTPPPTIILGYNVATFTVSFSPMDDVIIYGAISIFSNDNDDNPFSFPLKAAGFCKINPTKTLLVSTDKSYEVPSGKRIYSESGIYNDTLVNNTGCDSIITIILTIKTIINELPSPPIVTNYLNYCMGDIAEPIEAIGENLKWYTSPNAGAASTTAPVPSTNTSSVYLYYVSQTIDAVESERAVVVVNVLSNSTAPDVLSTVDYCLGSTAVPLVAYGSNLKCYNTSTGGISTNMPVIPSTNTIGTTNYFVSQNYNGCESSRSVITVNVHNIPTAPTAATPVNYCLGSTSNPLSATGSNLYWYASVGDCSGTGVSPTPSTSVVGSASYFVSQTVNGCESAKKEINVIVNNSVAAPIVVSPLSLFLGVNAPALTASGTNLKWYTSESGGAGSIQAPIPSTAVAGMTDYYVSQTVNGCESERALIKVIVNGDLSGPTCFNLGATYTFSLSPVHTVNATNYSWWVNGSVQSIVSSNVPRATISVGQYYTTGQVCVGVNYNQFPWYKQFCTSTIGLCSNGSSSAYRMGNGNATALVEVSPNPSNDNFNIQAFSSIKQITIKNMLGQEVYSIGDMSENQTINFGAELASGMYIIQYMAEDGLKHTVSIIKQ